MPSFKHEEDFAVQPIYDDEPEAPFFKERYHLMVGPLVLVLGVSLSDPSSGLLGWVTGISLAALTINRILP